ncbi:MAG TPA: hypothetical protein VGY48_01935 [Vicinamibacterales bacterium]|nr:hypothetical protein [Vicinamibacterales bacterium]
MAQTLAEQNKQLALKAFDALFNRHDYDAAASPRATTWCFTVASLAKVSRGR